MRHGKIDNTGDINISENRFLKRLIVIISVASVIYFYFKQHSSLIEKVSSIKYIHTFIFIMLLLLVLIILHFIFKKEYKIEKLFLMIVVPIGLIYTLLIPPGIVPDEWTHMLNCFSVSSMITGKEINNKCTMKQGEYQLYSTMITSPSNEYYDYIYSNIISLEESENYVTIDNPSPSLTQLFAYFPAIFGVTVGRVLHLGAVPTVYLGRLFNFVFYIVLTYSALKKIPFGKLLLFSITMLPMTCHQMFTLSYDSVINATAFFCIAYGMFFVYLSDIVKKKDILFYSLGGVLLLTIKGSAYAFILVIPILAKYFNPNGYEVAKRTKIIIFVIVVFTIIVLNFKSFFDSEVSSTIETVTGNSIVSWSGTPAYTLSDLLSNIPWAIQLFINTFIVKGNEYIGTTIGSQLGWLNILLPTWIVNAWMGILVTSAIDEESNNTVFTYEHKLLYFLIAFGVILVVMLAMALDWTPNTYFWIEGVQGRYFIPVLFLLLIWMQNTKVYLHTKIRTILIIVIPVMSIISIYNLIPMIF